MDKKTVVDLVKALRAVHDLYYSAANQACQENSPHDVYDHISKARAADNQARRLEMRYSDRLVR